MTKPIEEQIAELEALDKARTRGVVAIDRLQCGNHYMVILRKDGSTGHVLFQTSSDMNELTYEARERRLADENYFAAAPTMMQLIRTLWAENQKQRELLGVAMKALASCEHYRETGEYYFNSAWVKRANKQLSEGL